MKKLEDYEGCQMCDKGIDHAPCEDLHATMLNDLASEIESLKERMPCEFCGALGGHTSIYSLADLLANKSWTRACGISEADVNSAMYLLRHQGNEACIEYIKKTIN